MVDMAMADAGAAVVAEAAATVAEDMVVAGVARTTTMTITIRNVNETSTGDCTATPPGNGGIPSTVSTISQSQASTGGTKRGGQNGNQFGTNRP